MMTFIAKFTSGACADCDAPIKAGDEVSRNLDQDYVHVECPNTELELLALKQACPSCWMVGPCDCE